MWLFAAEAWDLLVEYCIKMSEVSQAGSATRLWQEESFSHTGRQQKAQGSQTSRWSVSPQQQYMMTGVIWLTWRGDWLLGVSCHTAGSDRTLVGHPSSDSGSPRTLETAWGRYQGSFLLQEWWGNARGKERPRSLWDGFCSRWAWRWHCGTSQGGRFPCGNPAAGAGQGGPLVSGPLDARLDWSHCKEGRALRNSEWRP